MHGSANIQLLELAAKHLEEIVQEVAFVGGATAVVDGRPEIAEELAIQTSEMTAYIREAIRALLDDQDFLDALPGFLPGDSASQARRPILEKRLRDIAGESLEGAG